MAAEQNAYLVARILHYIPGTWYLVLRETLFNTAILSQSKSKYFLTKYVHIKYAAEWKTLQRLQDESTLIPSNLSGAKENLSRRCCNQRGQDVLGVVGFFIVTRPTSDDDEVAVRIEIPNLA